MPATGVRSSAPRAPGTRSSAPIARSPPPAAVGERVAPTPFEPWLISATSKWVMKTPGGAPVMTTAPIERSFSSSRVSRVQLADHGRRHEVARRVVEPHDHHAAPALDLDLAGGHGHLLSSRTRRVYAPAMESGFVAAWPNMFDWHARSDLPRIPAARNRIQRLQRPAGRGAGAAGARRAPPLPGAGSERVRLRRLRSAAGRAGSWSFARCERRRTTGTCTVYRPDIGGLLPVYVYDRYEGFEVRTFDRLSDEELDRYLDANVAAVREVGATGDLRTSRSRTIW